ncbi:MAG: ROK family protein [Candidatus Omnitrophota bacterium]
MIKYVIGIDVGGTNVKLGLVNGLGRILARTNLATKRYVQNKGKLIAAIIEATEGLIANNHLRRKHIKGIGIGLPGLIDPYLGVVNFLPNIPKWKNVPLKKILEKRLKIPVYLENDVNLIALGEWKFGAGRGVKNMICMTLGTGVGSGLILNNSLYRGEGYVAGELGHVPLNEKGPACSCGGFACFERYVGNGPLLRKASRIFHKKTITFQEIKKLAAGGDRRALKFWEETAIQIGNGLIGAVNLLNPTLIVIGGGVSNNYRYFHKKVTGVIRERAMRIQAKMVRLARAQLGDDAGIIGAQVLINDAKVR